MVGFRLGLSILGTIRTPTLKLRTPITTCGAILRARVAAQAFNGTVGTGSGALSCASVYMHSGCRLLGDGRQHALPMLFHEYVDVLLHALHLPASAHGRYTKFGKSACCADGRDGSSKLIS